MLAKHAFISLVLTFTEKSLNHVLLLVLNEQVAFRMSETRKFVRRWHLHAPAPVVPGRAAPAKALQRRGGEFEVRSGRP